MAQMQNRFLGHVESDFWVDCVEFVMAREWCVLGGKSSVTGVRRKQYSRKQRKFVEKARGAWRPQVLYVGEANPVKHVKRWPSF